MKKITAKKLNKTILFLLYQRTCHDPTPLQTHRGIQRLPQQQPRQHALQRPQLQGVLTATQ